MAEEHVLVGRIVKPHGIRGELVVELHSDVPDRFAPGTVVTGRGRDLTVESSRPHQGRLLVRFEEVADRSAAEVLRGLELFAPPADLTDEDVYYARELVGVAVRMADGRALGVVADLVEIPAAAGYDLLEVERADGTRWLLPAVDEYVEVEEAADGGITLVLVDPPGGLVDESAAEVAAPGEEETG